MNTGPQYDYTEDEALSATVLDADNQIFSKGMGRISKDELQGAFWPQSPTTQDQLIKIVTSIQTEDGRRFRIGNLKYFRADYPYHGHYGFEILPPP
jgi:hypothetical protein